MPEPRYMRNKWTSQVGKLLPCEGDFHTVYVEPEPGYESMPARWPRGDCVEVHERRTWFVCDVCKADTHVDDYHARDGTTEEAPAPEGWKKIDVHDTDMKPGWVWRCPEHVNARKVNGEWYGESIFKQALKNERIYKKIKEADEQIKKNTEIPTFADWKLPHVEVVHAHDHLCDLEKHPGPAASESDVVHTLTSALEAYGQKPEVDETKQKEIAFIAAIEGQASPRVRRLSTGQSGIPWSVEHGQVRVHNGNNEDCWDLDDCRVILDDVPKDKHERTRRNPKKPEINWKGMHSNCKCELKFKPLTAEEDVLLPATPPKELLSLDEIHRQEREPLSDLVHLDRAFNRQDHKLAAALAGAMAGELEKEIQKSILAEPQTFTNLDGPTSEEIREAIEEVRSISLSEPLQVKVPIPRRGLMEEHGKIIHKEMARYNKLYGPPSMLEPQESPEYEKFAAELVDQTLPMLNAEATPFMEIPLPDDGKSKGKTVGDFEKWALPIIQSRFPKLSLGKPVDKDLEFAEEIERMQQEIMKTVGLPLKYLERYANSKVNPDFYGTVTIPADKEENMEQEKEFKPGDKVKAPNGAFGVVMKKGYYRGSGGVVYVRIDFGGYEDGYEQQVLTMVEKAQPKTGMLFNVGDEVTHKEEPDWGIGEIKELKRSREGFRGAKVLWQGDDSTILSVLTDLEVVTPAGEVKREDDKISGVVMDDIVAAVKVLTPDVSEGDIRKKVGEYLGDLGNKAFMAGIRSGKTKLTADIMEHKIKECWEFGDKPNDKHRTGDERKVAAQVSLPEQDQGRRVAPNGQFFRRSTHTPRQLGKIIRKVPGDSYDY